MRKKIITTIFMIALVFALSFTLAACGKKDKPTEKPSDNPAEYTITFDSKGGSAVKQIKAKAGDEIKAPDEPTKSGFEFLGWFESTDGGTTLAEKEFAINYMPAKNITLYAKWLEISEVGKKYVVKDYKTDINFEWEDPKNQPEDPDQYKINYAGMWLSFKENNAIEMFFFAGFEDNGHFYAINSENCVEFFETSEDAKSMTNKLTNDYFGFKYQFNSSKDKITVTQIINNEGKVLKITIVLTAVK